MKSATVEHGDAAPVNHGLEAPVIVPGFFIWNDGAFAELSVCSGHTIPEHDDEKARKSPLTPQGAFPFEPKPLLFFQVCQRPRGVEFINVSEVEELDHVYPALAGLDRGNKGLRALQRLCGLMLG